MFLFNAAYEFTVMHMSNLVYEEINQRSQQKQESLSLSLSGISPIWAKRLERKPFLVSLTRLRWLSEIADPQKCVVGEAYGFSSSYIDSCRQCASIANKFSLYFALCWQKKLQGVQSIFVRHWNENHLWVEQYRLYILWPVVDPIWDIKSNDDVLLKYLH